MFLIGVQRRWQSKIALFRLLFDSAILSISQVWMKEDERFRV